MSQLITEDLNEIAESCCRISGADLIEIKELGASSIRLIVTEYPPGNTEKIEETCVEIVIPSTLPIIAAVKIGALAGLSRIDGRMWSSDVFFKETPLGILIVYPVS